MNRRQFLKGSLAMAALTALGLRAEAKKEKAKAKEEAPKPLEAKAKKAGLSTRNLGKIGADISLLGFGLMRLPQKDGKIDMEKGQALIDQAMKAGVNYYDTAWVYHGGKSETFIGEALKKYPRESFYLADKLPVWDVHNLADAERIFNEQLKRCQVEYFDFFLLHSLNGGAWPKVKEEGSLEYAKKMKKEGKIKRLGFSFHGDNKDLAQIVKEESWDFAQIQLNYFDWDDYSREQYEILTKANIPVIVMEPLRGGELANLKPQTQKMLTDALAGSTPAQWAFRFAGTLPNVLTILSGMETPEIVAENLKTFSPLNPIAKGDLDLFVKVKKSIQEEGRIPCTGCRYCMPCPAGVAIPEIFKHYNEYRKTLTKWVSARAYYKMKDAEKATACVNCGACSKKCPQKINIPEELKRVHKELLG